MKIDTSNWKKFKISDLFEIKGSKTTKHNNLSQFKTEINCYPYITTAATNNGVSGWSDFYTENGNVITIDSAVLGKAFYQEYNFTASDHVEKLIPKFNMSKMIGCFIVAILDKTGKQIGYSYSKKRSQKALKEEEIILPIISDGSPDWQYMESYMQNLWDKIEITFKKENNNNRIDTSKWKKFKISDLFEVKKGRIGHTKDLREGNMPLVTSSAINNGIDKYVDVPFTNEKCITVGGVGLAAFWQENKFAASCNCNILTPKNFILEKYKALFVCSCFKQIQNKYVGQYINFGPGRLEAEEILLPVTLDGTPDWQYMENFMRDIESRSVLIQAIKERQNV